MKDKRESLYGNKIIETSRHLFHKKLTITFSFHLDFYQENDLNNKEPSDHVMNDIIDLKEKEI